MIINGESRVEIKEFIQGKLKISDRRCKFIARQETALLTTKFKAEQYKEFGIDKYEWRTVGQYSGPHPVRDSHQHLEGKICNWNKREKVNDNPERYAHPGEDFNCRCQAVPIVEW
jgi:SPP1 gp7 family putative phage head morphogenesis protein